MQLQVENSPFNQEQAELLNRLLPTLSDNQRIWLSGYLTAIGGSALAVTPIPGQAVSAVPVAQAVPAIPKEVTVLFGSQTGNSQRLAKGVSQKLEGQGFAVTLSSMSDFKPNNLKKVSNLLIVVSTHGEGDPPDNAIPFHEFLYSKRAPKLEDLRFSVLALGDSSYEFFCKTGKDFDTRLEELGGQRISPRVDCDVDYDDPAAEWMESVVSSLNALAVPQAVGVPAGAAVTVGASALSVESEYSRTNPFQAEMLENLNLNGRGSAKETRHLELSLEGSGLQFEPGDSLGVYPENHPDLVDSLIQEMGWKPDEPVPMNKKGDICPLRQALTQNYEITVLTKPLMEQAAQLSSSSELKDLLASGREQELKAYLEGRDLLDLVQDYKLKGLAAAEFVSILRKMPPRLYSIASSQKANPDEVHLTIATVRYETGGRNRYGVCSTQVAERLDSGDSLPVFVQNNPNFKLPENPDTPIIMIGPGTGVAPFRAFLQEREELGAEGKNWLFFGDQHFVTDFLYQIEMQRWLKDGVLTKLDVAFSRDTEQKVYVQHRMLENSRELYSWIEQGAHIYVCGDEKRMAHDVHATLITILEKEGDMSPEKAATFLTELQQQKRYQRDVY